MTNILKFTKEFDEDARDITHASTRDIINDIVENDKEVRQALKLRLLASIDKMEKFDFGYNTSMNNVINTLINTEDCMEVIKKKIEKITETEDMQYEINQAFTKVIMAKFGVVP